VLHEGKDDAHGVLWEIKTVDSGEKNLSNPLLGKGHHTQIETTMNPLRFVTSNESPVQLAVAGAFAAALLLPVACATGTSGGAASTVSASTIQCRLDDGSAMADNAKPEHGVYYEDRHGIYYEPCIDPNGKLLTHYVYWEGAQYIILGNNETTIDPRGLGEEPQRGGITFYEFSEDRPVCQGNRCKSRSKLININDGGEMSFALDWVGCKAGAQLEVMEFDLNGGENKVSCASYRVKGEACRQAVSTFKSLLGSKKYPVPEGLQLTDKWCD
jgi:hypothetical protein